jgi:hypothetical protein
MEEELFHHHKRHVVLRSLRTSWRSTPKRIAISLTTRDGVELDVTCPYLMGVTRMVHKSY